MNNFECPSTTIFFLFQIILFIDMSNAQRDRDCFHFASIHFEHSFQSVAISLALFLSFTVYILCVALTVFFNCVCKMASSTANKRNKSIFIFPSNTRFHFSHNPRSNVSIVRTYYKVHIEILPVHREKRYAVRAGRHKQASKEQQIARNVFWVTVCVPANL